MKKLIFLLMAMLIYSCSPQKKIYSNFDISYARSGGLSPIYENLLIKGNKAHYSFEGRNKKTQRDIVLTDQEVADFQKVLEENNFLKIQEDYKKVYDHISTNIRVANGKNKGAKTDAAMIQPKYQRNWDAITAYFQDFIQTKKLNP